MTDQMTSETPEPMDYDEAPPVGPSPTVRTMGTISIPVGLILLGLFFLPWVDFGCDGPSGRLDLIKASGLQLVTGGISKGTGADDIMGQMGGDLGNGATVKSTGPSDAELDEVAEEVGPKPWFVLGLICPIIIVLAGFRGLSGGDGQSVGMMLIVAGALGLLTCFSVFTVDYMDAMMKMEEKKKQGGDQSSLYQGSNPLMSVLLLPAGDLEIAQDLGKDADAIGKDIEKLGDKMGEEMGKELGNAMESQMESQMKQFFSTKPTAFMWISLLLYVGAIVMGVIAKSSSST